jgi:type IV secretion system protein VirB10
MRKNKVEQPLGLPGERSLPHASAKQRPIKRGMAAFFVLVGLLMTCCFSYMSYHRSHKLKHENAPKHMQLTHAVPARTFHLSENKNNLSPKVISFSDKAALLIDKSDAALMSSKEKQAPSLLDKSTMESALSGQIGLDQGALGSLGGMLHSTPTPVRAASVLKNRNYVLAKGGFIDCVLQTKLDTTVPGMTSCVVTRNIYSDTGKLLLIERGSTVSGEYQSSLKQGQARIFILWNRIKTPSGVVMNLDSPGTDGLGGGGVEGYVDTHFWQRFGGAIMLSLVQDFAASLANNIDNRADATITLKNTSDASQSMAVEALKNSINIPPTLYKNQGERVGIYVARDLDFYSVYGLQPI